MTKSKSLAGLARLAWIATAFALVVIVFGAFVRLSYAGLSCPDWPTCYGQITWPAHANEIASANAAFPDRMVDTTRAWREQVHRFLAGGLILTTFALAFWAWRRRTDLATLRFGGLAKVLLAASAFILFQALLGMWTVTWKLKPIVVMGHLVGGITTFALLAYTALRLTIAPAQSRPRFGNVEKDKLRRLTIVGIALVAAQIALGGWTSANYASLACGIDFPTCLGHWWPQTDFREAFVLWRGIGVNYEGGVLDAAARTAIQLTHRIGALLVFGHLAFAVIQRALRYAPTRAYAIAIALALVAQIGLGIANVRLGLPLPIATAHNGMAALLLLTLLALLVRVRREI
ncbi:MAG: heme A synthase [Gammaproteobacteria bacterium]|nr:MAG: heme A synthase [Gammaproteobacteria bacterium]